MDGTSATLEALRPYDDCFGATTCVIVDDSEDVRWVIRNRLERIDVCRVVGEAADGVEAVRVAARTQPDVIFLDQVMPEVDGITALPAILASAPGTKVVMLSSSDARVYAAAALEAGATAYVEKSLNIDFASVLSDVLAS